MPKLPILILHGWNLSAEKFRPLQRELEKQRYKVYGMDLPGFGKAVMPKKPLFLSDYVTFVASYLKSKKIDRAVIIGHSFGGRVAIKLAVACPELVASLILTGTPGLAPASRTKIMFFLFLSKIGKKIFRLPGLHVFEKSARNFLYSLAGAADYQRAEGVMRETFKNIIKEDLVVPMEQINCPTLLIWGEQDKIVPKETGVKMMKIINHSRLTIIPDARHGLPWTHPGLFVAGLEKFLQDL